MFKKIKSLFKKSNPDTGAEKPIDKAKNTPKTAKPKQILTAPTAKPTSHPITCDIMAWLDKQDWKYDHRPPDDGGHTHHLIMGFTDRENDWTCVFRINEDNQLVSAFGILDDSVPVSHYTAMLMEIAKMNMNVSFGGIEFDPTDGEVRAKIAFDVEFNPLTDKSLGCYLQALAGLTEVARGVMTLVLADDEPSQFAGDYVDVGDEIKAVVDDEKRTFFLPTHTAQ
ncbi:hypothetical protein LP090_11775 [Moraxella bovis]|uniref:hypothetical protein n=1 Tax=Moraxella bovis TaxID=476 RepID=UPI0022276302|nr:hypothetical protein [Moraxella bovis]UYZ71141.1 hypothetical protein LP089_01245 [Moraxella bovis]UYZ72942.1 hypothetical protein LP105_11385 [Moraxella bovis]UZA14436.1 hypothetical protein LP102_01200 [Moraxella bovis]UZA42823.1 hypothetical protein LP090_11775 [Moraxella bovis]WAJ73391.1 hypothetical protein LP095_11875 [Moraxella bovis]